MKIYKTTKDTKPAPAPESVEPEAQEVETEVPAAPPPPITANDFMARIFH